jgi:hypothetical protein
MCLVWLVPAVLLSSTVGGFTSRRAGLRVIHELQDELGDLWPISDLDKIICKSTIHSPITSRMWESTDTLDEALPYIGGNYSYRPSKYVFPSNTPADRRNKFAPDRPPVQLFFYATLPVVFAAGCAMALSCITPTIGLGCRLLSPPFTENGH